MQENDMATTANNWQTPGASDPGCYSYYAIFASRCLIGRGNSVGLSAPDLAILRHALLRGRTFSLGAMVAKWLSLNRTKGPIFRGMYASRLAKYFEIPIRDYEKEEKVLPLFT